MTMYAAIVIVDGYKIVKTMVKREAAEKFIKNSLFHFKNSKNVVVSIEEVNA